MTGSSGDPDRAGGTPGPSLRVVIAYLIGIAGLAFSLTILFIEMRAVLDVGGSCADGGPYVSAQPCPDGTWLMFLAIFGGFGWGALALAAGASIGGRFAVLPYLSWSVLFCSLGLNFLQYGLDSPLGGGLEIGFLIPGVLFEVMGIVPLIFGLKFSGSVDATTRERLRVARLAAGLRPASDPASYAGLGEALAGGLATASSTTSTTSYSNLSEALAALGPEIERAVSEAQHEGLITSSGHPTGGLLSVVHPPADLAGELERLAQLHTAGSLTDEEFAAAKAALLHSAKTGPEAQA